MDYNMDFNMDYNMESYGFILFFMENIWIHLD